ncbi:hypothetical protein [Streptomyces sp. RP5T]|uniref:8-oxoguanine DNA glycosylase OGG fold protein n=1 Tax=Streptomyces sp. RP5T TaxID=2490848 RepID=UPI0034D96270
MGDGPGPGRCTDLPRDPRVDTNADTDATAVPKAVGAPTSTANATRNATSPTGPSFYTKCLYFVGRTAPTATGPQPLVFDRVLARRLRSWAQEIGRETGQDVDRSIAGMVWRDSNWSPHRYAVYLSFMQAAAQQVTTTGNWPSPTSPDLQYALFSASWT